MRAIEQFRVPPPDRFRLAEYNPAETHGWDEARCADAMQRNVARIAEVQNVLYAEKRQALLVVLQSMDTGGKDPIIRDVLYSVNPQACRVTAFKKATGAEKHRDYFWRFHQAVPMRGEIGVFNRSYFDEVIAGNAHDDTPADRRRTLLEHINHFERMLTDNDIRVVKLYLHMSKEEQRKRLQERLDNPHRHWELSESDFEERKYWEGYMRAYEEALKLTNTEAAPWYLIPSDNRQFRDYAASQLLVETLEDMNPQYPPASFDLSTVSLD